MEAVEDALTLRLVDTRPIVVHGQPGPALTRFDRDHDLTMLRRVLAGVVEEDADELVDEEGYWYAWYLASGYAVDAEGNDTHGAGAVRFDTKTEDGPDGVDAERGENYVRLVRGGEVTETPEGDPTTVNPDRVVSFDDGETSVGATAGGPGGGPQDEAGAQQGPDMAAAAERLGVTEEEVMAALGAPAPGEPPDLEADAEILGVSVEELEAVLGPAPGN